LFRGEAVSEPASRPETRMRRRRLLISVGLVLGFLALVVVGLIAMVKREPSYYRQADLPAGDERTRLSLATVTQVTQLNRTLDEPSWTIEFSTEQLNAFFQDDYYKLGGDENLTDDCHAPRVKVEDGKMRVGVRYGAGLLSTVLSLEIKLWKVPSGVNTLAMEIVSLQAGSLPLSTSTLLDRISEAARRENIEIAWYRHEGHPVAVMRFQADLTRPTFQFDQIELKDGRMVVTGRSMDLLGPPPPRVVSKP
jgi:hypothetical protein